jgi:hypothetical protein
MISGKDVTLMGRTKNCQERGTKLIGVVVNRFSSWCFFAASMKASKARMDFFPKRREQKASPGCLRANLSGKGQESLTAPIPAPGGDQ